MAGPESTACVHAAYTCVAPSRISASAVFTSVPAVSMMSSTIRALRPRTSPIRFMTSLTSTSTRRLSTMARGVELFCKEAGAFHAARIRRNDRKIRQIQMAEMLDQDGRAVQVIDGNVEVALNLRRVQIERQRAACAGCFQQVGDELC